MENVTITRYWHNPEIITYINDREISLSVALDDFIKALIQEIGSVTLVVKQETFENRVNKAKDTVLKRIKEESLKTIKNR